MKKLDPVVMAVFMTLLAIVNINIFVFQPCKESPFDHVSPGHHLGGLVIFALMLGLIIYLPLVIIGTYSTVKTLYHFISGESKRSLASLLFAIFTLISLSLVTYGTFWKEKPKDPRDIEREKEIEKSKKDYEDRLLLKSYGGPNGIIIDNRCAYWGNSIIFKEGNNVDTLIVNSADNTCHWTYNPEVNYEIIFDNRNKYGIIQNSNSIDEFLDYRGKLQYIINSINNKCVDQYHCDKDSYKYKFENDSVICFAVDSIDDDWHDKKAFLLFRIQDSIATLVDSSSNIYKDRKDYVGLNTEGFIKKENGMPILKTRIRMEQSPIEKTYTHYYDYYDIEKKKFVLKALVLDEKYDSVTNKTHRIEVDIRDYMADIKYKNGYPVLQYTKFASESKENEVSSSEDDKKVIETGEYRMKNGKYQKIKTNE